MDAVAAPGGIALDPGYISLSALSPGSKGVIVSVGAGSGSLTPLTRRLLELGFCSGEHVEIIAEARPGRDPFVVRVGNKTLALRRFASEHSWVEISSAVSSTRPPYPPLEAPKGVEITRHVSSSRPLNPPLEAPKGV